ncbi:hypothetical protein DENSPDRAFT_885182 [Dentipellis sp. KUC8613]|nr:hypothetical protein DENSPDRAFT_885182 [Dentipellis sp. KUC8613]
MPLSSTPRRHLRPTTPSACPAAPSRCLAGPARLSAPHRIVLGPAVPSVPHAAVFWPCWAVCAPLVPSQWEMMTHLYCAHTINSTSPSCCTLRPHHWAVFTPARSCAIAQALHFRPPSSPLVRAHAPSLCPRAALAPHRAVLSPHCAVFALISLFSPPSRLPRVRVPLVSVSRCRARTPSSALVSPHTRSSRPSRRSDLVPSHSRHAGLAGLTRALVAPSSLHLHIIVSVSRSVCAIAPISPASPPPSWCLSRPCTPPSCCRAHLTHPACTLAVRISRRRTRCMGLAFFGPSHQSCAVAPPVRHHACVPFSRLSLHARGLA